MIIDNGNLDFNRKWKKKLNIFYDIKFGRVLLRN